MKSRNAKKKTDIILRNGKPISVIFDIDEYKEMLKRLEDIEGLKILEEMIKETLKFGDLGDFLKCDAG